MESQSATHVNRFGSPVSRAPAARAPVRARGDSASRRGTAATAVPRHREIGDAVQRLVLVGTLKEGSAGRARDLVRGGPPFDPGERGFDRHGVYLTTEHVTFIFESDAADAALQDLLTERLQSEAFHAWASLLEGPPQPALEGYYWKRTG